MAAIKPTNTAPHSPDDLSFGRREPDGSYNWWPPSPLKSRFTYEHEWLGEEYAREVIALLRNPDRELDEDGSPAGGSVLPYIALDQAGKRMDTCEGGFLLGFYREIAAALAEPTGPVPTEPDNKRHSKSLATAAATITNAVQTLEDIGLRLGEEDHAETSPVMVVVAALRDADRGIEAHLTGGE